MLGIIFNSLFISSFELSDQIIFCTFVELFVSSQLFFISGLSFSSSNMVGSLTSVENFNLVFSLFFILKQINAKSMKTKQIR